MTNPDRLEVMRTRLDHAGLDLACELVPCCRNRHLRLRLLSTGGGAGCAVTNRLEPSAGLRLLPGFDPNPGLVLRVSYPPRFSRRRVMDEVLRNWPWVTAQVNRSRELPPPPGRGPLVTGARLWHRGRKLVLYVLPHLRRRPRWVLHEDRLLWYTSRPAQSDLRHDLERWYRQRARELIEERLRELAPAITPHPCPWRVRGQKSRWGSCSAGRSLSFNWKLVMMPDFAVNYIVVHELAHLQELNHSPCFWRLVRHHCPYAETARVWLRRHGPELDW